MIIALYCRLFPQKKHNWLTGLMLVLASLILFTSCRQSIISGHGDIVTVPRSVPAFTKIQIDAPVDATIKVVAGAAPGIQLKGYKNILDNIETKVANGNLKVTVKDGIIINTDEHLKVEISTAMLDKLTISGAANAELSGYVSSKAFDMDVAGAGDVLVNSLNTSRLNIHLSGAGTVAMNSGIVDEAQYKITGAGNLKAFGLVCSNVTAEVSGAGSVKLHATKTLNAKITGAGSISYKGQPAITSATGGAGYLENAN